jgi:endonuclease/exonuclease/phosphatase family metal-dependent hydrolase
MMNLIKKYKIKTTRSSFTPAEKGKFADYIFTSSEVNVHKFKVLKAEVSDHLPLLLEFN